MSGYYLAPALEVLRDEINRRWPGRDRGSDGWIGDAAHQAGRSDHNPNDRGSVDAIDVDKDGVDVSAVIAAVERHPSAHYWIYQRQIADRDDGWRRRPYTGSNPHDHHLHVSIRQSKEAEQDRRPWGLLEDEMSTKAENEIHQVYVGLFNGGSSMGRSVDPDGAGAAKGSNSIVAKLDYLLSRLDGVAAGVTTLAGRDWTDEPAIVAGVLAGLGPDRLAQALTAAGLTPEAIAAAVPPDMARQVVDELTARLAS
ncbi:hypothetical protein C5N14_13590 [Micromonospora sp. MW-13]|uniref:hypothetical protein n=1 Tax=Micromonospora sp. MW-13 TaxID=2094022 RepID=UPI000EC32CC2|nr:hypothetical protein [Micromonospora sp. MW-13]RGC68414.1 hypothetical protein C5N14_13590 [Micromonospora sp. MW-13]